MAQTESVVVPTTFPCHGIHNGFKNAPSHSKAQDNNGVPHSAKEKKMTGIPGPLKAIWQHINVSYVLRQFFCLRIISLHDFFIYLPGWTFPHIEITMHGKARQEYQIKSQHRRNYIFIRQLIARGQSNLFLSR
ncbi:hypothetical protein [Desulfocicer niacini]